MKETTTDSITQPSNPGCALPAMEYARCGRSGLKLPRISLGLWHNFGTYDDPATMRAILVRAFDAGVTHFDLANNYGPEPGSAEGNFGAILGREFAGHRDEIVVSTKAGHAMWPGPYGDWGSRKSLVASIDQSLRRMKLDYVSVLIGTSRVSQLEENLRALSVPPLTQAECDEIDAILDN